MLNHCPNKSNIPVQKALKGWSKYIITLHGVMSWMSSKKFMPLVLGEKKDLQQEIHFLNIMMILSYLGMLASMSSFFFFGEKNQSIRNLGNKQSYKIKLFSSSLTKSKCIIGIEKPILCSINYKWIIGINDWAKLKQKSNQITQQFLVRFKK